jgi:hypothetical protein
LTVCRLVGRRTNSGIAGEHDGPDLVLKSRLYANLLMNLILDVFRSLPTSLIGLVRSATIP